VAPDQFDEKGVRLVQYAVVEDQHAVVEADLGARLLPEGFRVGLQAVQQAGEGVVGGAARPLRLDARRLGALAALGVAIKKSM